MKVEERKLVERLLIMVAGDPTVNDEDSADHYSNSVMGRLEAGTRHMASTDAKIELVKLDLLQKLDDNTKIRQLEMQEIKSLIQTLQKDKFGWDQVLKWLRTDGRWWKIAGLTLAGLYFVYDRGWFP